MNANCETHALTWFNLYGKSRSHNSGILVNRKTGQCDSSFIDVFQLAKRYKIVWGRGVSLNSIIHIYVLLLLISFYNFFLFSNACNFTKSYY